MKIKSEQFYLEKQNAIKKILYDLFKWFSHVKYTLRYFSLFFSVFFSALAWLSS